jgi:hypothetical protein
VPKARAQGSVKKDRRFLTLTATELPPEQWAPRTQLAFVRNQENKDVAVLLRLLDDTFASRHEAISVAIQKIEEHSDQSPDLGCPTLRFWLGPFLFAAFCPSSLSNTIFYPTRFVAALGHVRQALRSRPGLGRGSAREWPCSTKFGRLQGLFEVALLADCAPAIGRPSHQTTSAATSKQKPQPE